MKVSSTSIIFLLSCGVIQAVLADDDLKANQVWEAQVNRLQAAPATLFDLGMFKFEAAVQGTKFERLTTAEARAIYFQHLGVIEISANDYSTGYEFTRTMEESNDLCIHLLTEIKKGLGWAEYLGQDAYYSMVGPVGNLFSHETATSEQKITNGLAILSITRAKAYITARPASQGGVKCTTTFDEGAEISFMECTSKSPCTLGYDP